MAAWYVTVVTQNNSVRMPGKKQEPATWRFLIKRRFKWSQIATGAVMNGRGRTSRKRKKKRDGVPQSFCKPTCVAAVPSSDFSTSANLSCRRPVPLSHRPEYVELLRFLHRRGFTSTLLQPALFSDTGRGLQAVRSIKPGQLLISLPESCLLTPSTVLDSYLGQYIKSWRRRLSSLLALCVFLVCERHRGPDAEWWPYVRVLPASYACPAYFAHAAAALLPARLRRRAVEQEDTVREMHSSNRDFFRTLQPVLRQPVEDVLTFDALRWAWCSVNTRSVFMIQPSNEFLHGQNDYALAPFLDLLNHRPDAQVKAGFNHETRSYEIRSAGGTPRFRQAFINYGSHDNQRLLLEYGFIAPDNPHSVVYVDAEMLREVLKGDAASLEQKMKFLEDNNFLSNLSVCDEGPSWRLTTALRLMALPQTLFHRRKAVLLGQAVGEAAERQSVQTAAALCRRLLRDAIAALEKISKVLQQGEPSLREQLRLVESLWLEEKCILGKCLRSLSGSQAEAAHTDVDERLADRHSRVRPQNNAARDET
ncbi:SET domain-containing protein 4 isoform X2 [Syngnathoides biaculeatus]|uniref:SET domain-containing protein 4 isoform X2 n=1 Tax=Syngnathoides biaculeatus TaxID=300417 RepID=UPI002ADDCA60|nr:SET domain-containing protein 4 isoform X2 [Syngnathoides biaculeatus]